MAENAQDSTAAPKNCWYHNVWFVLFMLFFVLGPFGIPLVWSSPRFSRPVKILLTVVVVAFTAWIVAVAIDVAREVVNRVNALSGPMPPE